jgi:hypothetical protein
MILKLVRRVIWKVPRCILTCESMTLGRHKLCLESHLLIWRYQDDLLRRPSLVHRLPFRYNRDEGYNRHPYRTLPIPRRRCAHQRSNVHRYATRGGRWRREVD